MPQATDELRARWHSDEGDGKAWEQLGDNFTTHLGVIRPNPGYVASDDDLSAVDYLCQEWDYGYDGIEASPPPPAVYVHDEVQNFYTSQLGKPFEPQPYQRELIEQLNRRETEVRAVAIDTQGNRTALGRATIELSSPHVESIWVSRRFGGVEPARVGVVRGPVTGLIVHKCASVGLSTMRDVEVGIRVNVNEFCPAGATMLFRMGWEGPWQEVTVRADGMLINPKPYLPIKKASPKATEGEEPTPHAARTAWLDSIRKRQRRNKR